MAYLYLAAAFTLNAVANILLKLGAGKGLALQGTLFQIIALNWQFIVGLGIFALNVVFYFLALRMLPLSVAYPIMVAMSFLLINGYALLFLGESITPVQYAGYAFMIIGLMMVVMRGG